MSDPKKRRPTKVGDFLAPVLKRSGISTRLEQATIVDEWPRLVGPQIASVTRALSVTPDGVLRVGVRTNAWMNELSLVTHDILMSINARAGRELIRRIQFRLLGPDEI